MQLPRRLIWNRMFAGAVLGLVALSVFAPGSVHASCGDYLTADGHLRMSAKNVSADDSLPVMPMPHAPCSGPNCSGRDSTPPLPPPAPAPVAGEQWGCDTNLPTLHEPGFASWLVDFANSLPVRRANLIYHPPRHCSLFAI